MRFAAAAVILATTVIAHGHGGEEAEVSTAYETSIVTITACPDTVPDCPAESKTTSVVTVSEPPAIPTTAITPVVPTSISSHYNNSTVVYPPPAVSTESPPEEPTEPATPEEPTDSTPEEPEPTEPAALCPSSSVIAVTKSYTTVLTSVEYSTVEVPCPTTSAPPPPPPANTTVPPPVSPPTPTGGAASLAGSAVFAAVAGVAAFILA